MMMNTLHAKDMYVVIGDEYAKRMGYEEMVGSMGIIDSVLNALCGVTILTGNPGMIGKQLDVHIQDCILQEYGEKQPYDVVVDMTLGHILYTTNEEMFEFLQDYLQNRHEFRTFRNIHNIHEVLDMAIENMSKTAAKREFEWICFCLDSPDSDVAGFFLNAFEKDKHLKQKESEAFKKIANSSQVINLTAQLQQQMSKEPSMQEKLDELLKDKKAIKTDDDGFNVTYYVSEDDGEDYEPVDDDDDYDEREDDGDYELYS
jgi:hypothetical protein